MRENSVKEVAIGLSFASDWSREKEREGERERGATFVDEWQKPIIKNQFNRGSTLYLRIPDR